MTSCAYCPHPSTATIPANPGRVCVTHAIAFWTDYLAFARQARLEGIEEAERRNARLARRRLQRTVVAGVRA